MMPSIRVLVLAALLLAGCQSYPFAPANPPPPPTCDELAQQEQSPGNLSFEAMWWEHGYLGDSRWSRDEVGLFILTKPGDISQIEHFILEPDIAALNDVDYAADLAVVAFSGVKGQGAWQFCITSVTQQDGGIHLHAHLVDSPSHPAAEASYYYIIRLARHVIPTGDVTFQLGLTRHNYVDSTGRQRLLETSEEEIVATITHSVP